MIQRALFALLLAFWAIDVAAAGFQFGRPLRFATIQGPNGSIAIGDANGDGRQDFALAYYGDFPTLALFLQRPDGWLSAPLEVDLPTSYHAPVYEDWPIAFVDLDNDGKQEVFVGLLGRHGGQVVAKLADGVLTMGLPFNRASCSYVATGDIDGDGFTDVACHDDEVSATVLFGDGAGGFRNIIDLQTPGGTWYTDQELKGLQIGDVTGDGRPDLVVTSSVLRAFFVMENNGLGGFWPGAITYPHPYSSSGNYPSALQFVDTDGDGVDELVTVSPDRKPGAALNVYKQQSTGFLALARRVPTWDGTTAMQALDLDGDGDRELITAHHQFHAVSVIGSDGADLDGQARFDLPGFGNIPWDVYMRVGSSHTIAVGDLDGDGCPDMAGITFTGVHMLFGCDPYVSKIPVSDFDGDGIADALFRQGAGSGVITMMARARYFCSDVPYLCPPAIASNLDARGFGDFDADGNTDVLWRNGSTGENLVMLAAMVPRTLAPAGPSWKVVGTGDFDHDDHSDILWRNASTGANAIWRSADVKTPMAIASVNNLAWKVAAVGDFDGDGRSDVLWRNATSGANTIWRSANNLSQLSMTGVFNPAWKIVGVGDFDADGRDDVVWRNATTGAGSIWLAANSATQRAITSVNNPQWSITGIADYNEDGHSDLFWRNSGTGANTIWLTANNLTQQAVKPWPSSYPMVNPQP